MREMWVAYEVFSSAITRPRLEDLCRKVEQVRKGNKNSDDNYNYGSEVGGLGYVTSVRISNRNGTFVITTDACLRSKNRTFT